MEIALVNEGTYPYAPGGVSTWCDQLVRGLSEVSWHLVTVMAWTYSALLGWLAQPMARAASGGTVETAIAASLAAGAGLVLWSNRGRHPAWIALLAAAGLVLGSLH